MRDDPEHPMPRDPDLDDVPPDLAALDGKQITVTEPDGTTTTSTVLVVPELWGHARRYREGMGGDPQ